MLPIDRAHYVTGDIFVMSPPRQTLRAWAPFWDCVSILFQFQSSDVSDGDTELPEWRIHWVAGIALLRAVGHVLAKADAETSSAHAEIIASFWEELRRDRDNAEIFWQFIEKERNNLLKTYSFGARLVHGDDGGYIEFEGGRDAFQLFRQAVYWWRMQLMHMEAQIAAPPDCPR